jgi:hypothetical protein
VQGFSQRPTPPEDPLGPVTPAVEVRSSLPDVADEVAHGRDQAGVAVPVLMVQLGLLSVVVLYLVLGDGGRAATPRGRRRPVAGTRGTRARLLLLRELGPVVLAGVPTGALIAVALSALARDCCYLAIHHWSCGPASWPRCRGRRSSWARSPCS